MLNQNNSSKNYQSESKGVRDLPHFRIPKENWTNWYSSNNITKNLNPKELLTSLKENDLLEHLKNHLISSENMRFVMNLKMSSLGLQTTNVFVFNDPFRDVCNKCSNSGGIIILRDENYLKDLDHKVFIGTPDTLEGLFEFSYMEKIAVPINFKTDLWYCPFCDELHGFSYDKMTGLEFDQKIIDREDEF
ncbi:MAG: hypothetical protein ACOCRX_10020 [Candidatus Woesearchaeota archaeon]